MDPHEQEVPVTRPEQPPSRMLSANRDSIASITDEMRRLLARRQASFDEQAEKMRIRLAGNEELIARGISSLRGNITRLEHVIRNQEIKLSLLREPVPADVQERQDAFYHLSGRIQAASPPETPFLYHGSYFWSSRQIIESGSLSSSVDRLGAETSYDPADAVSVTSTQDCQVSIEYAADRDSADFCLPAGCVFVVMPTPEEALNKSPSAISNVDFRREPQRLIQVVTSTECAPAIAEIMAKSGFNPGLVSTFAQYPDRIAGLVAGASTS